MHEYQIMLREFLREQIRGHRKRQKLTQEAMAEELRISPRSYAYLEAGTYGCSAATLMFFLLILSDEEVLQLRMEFRVLVGKGEPYVVA